MQATVKSSVAFEGVGLHSGAPVRAVIQPALAEHGIWFRRVDSGQPDCLIPALWNAVEPTPLCTKLVNSSGVSVSTVEHLLAALVGCGIQNALVDVEGPELPVLDGSAAPFVRAILERGIRFQGSRVQAIEILKTVEFRRGCAVARLEPSFGFAMDVDIEFADAAIGHQRKALDLANGAFLHELCDSRTFCRQADVDAMRSDGKALGGSLDNAVVVDGDVILSPGGLRHGDEPVRHKMLDAVGDLALAGAPIIGRYVAERAGHSITHQLLRRLFSDPASYRFVECDAAMSARLPGSGVTKVDALTLQ